MRFWPSTAVQLPSGYWIIKEDGTWYPVDKEMFDQFVGEIKVGKIKDGWLRREQEKDKLKNKAAILATKLFSEIVYSERNGEPYEVRRDEKGNWSCQCIGFCVHKTHCRHINKMKLKYNLT